MKSSDILDSENNSEFELLSDSENNSEFEEEHNEFVHKENEIFEKIIYIPTLPSTFNSLVKKTVKLETDEPQCVIELLGDLLGVKDHEINKVAFWFLDTVALQVLRYKNCLDDYYRSILISWLAGEMKLIRDKQLLRENFFKEMRILFLYVAKKLSDGDRLPHWEVLMDAYSEIMAQNSTSNWSTDSETEYLNTNKSSEKELIAEDECAFQENKFTFVGKHLKNYKNSVTNNLEEKSPKNFKIVLTTENSRTDTITDENTIIESSNLMNPSDVLDVIVEATYNMYANELRYALIYAVFVKSIQMQMFLMPHAHQIQRQIKFALSGGSFDVQLRERLEEVACESIIDNEKEITDDMREDQMIEDFEIPPSPPSSLNEEEILTNNCRFILPLIEANEAVQIFEMHARSM
ncbi:hypothetical protein ALC56_05984 [Trachymyrmex septentrionalis]|uniref:Uncharacterized protein n=1 Tax=Trachymyrmex septentrionalis TaxID=34720 RepID=A0A195FGI4_9HYME|nr:hypothetical protein ALC56_05984 [Trachymyrmex septentrionalis]